MLYRCPRLLVLSDAGHVRAFLWALLYPGGAVDRVPEQARPRQNIGGAWARAGPSLHQARPFRGPTNTKNSRKLRPRTVDRNQKDQRNLSCTTSSSVQPVGPSP